MDSIDFGKYLYELRKQSGLTQRSVAYECNVSDKAVSKWEMGNSKPDLEKLKLLSALYNVPLEKLLNNKEEKHNMITKIVLTGGPCSGKKTALSWISNYFSNRGYTVLIVPDVMNELTESGVTPSSYEMSKDYELIQFRLQKEKEKIIEEAAKKMKNNKILIVCNRGILDIKANMKDMEFKRLLTEFKTNETKERDSYDAIFHLVSVAKGKEDIYTYNTSGKGNIEQARILDDKIISSWTGHPHLRIIDNSTGFEEKMHKLLKEIASFLGAPEPLEIERKYLIKYPNIKELENMPNCTKVNIIQTYLKSTNEVEKRVRARGIDGDYVYYVSEKMKISNLKRIEIERKITQDEYLRLLLEADSNLHTIHKTRYCLSENNQYFEIDIHPEWSTKAIMEIELSGEDDEIKIPKFIKIIKDVTDDERYKNYQMAKVMPKE